MNRLSPYVNEIISFIVMLLMLVALVAGQVNAEAYQLASLGAEAEEISRMATD